MTIFVIHLGGVNRLATDLQSAAWVDAADPPTSACFTVRMQSVPCKAVWEMYQKMCTDDATETVKMELAKSCDDPLQEWNADTFKHDESSAAVVVCHHPDKVLVTTHDTDLTKGVHLYTVDNQRWLAAPLSLDHSVVRATVPSLLAESVDGWHRRTILNASGQVGVVQATALKQHGSWAKRLNAVQLGPRDAETPHEAMARVLTWIESKLSEWLVEKQAQFPQGVDWLCQQPIDTVPSDLRKAVDRALQGYPFQYGLTHKSRVGGVLMLWFQLAVADSRAYRMAPGSGDILEFVHQRMKDDVVDSEIWLDAIADLPKRVRTEGMLDFIAWVRANKTTLEPTPKGSLYDRSIAPSTATP